jgi:hypothetical protein
MIVKEGFEIKVESRTAITGVKLANLKGKSKRRKKTEGEAGKKEWQKLEWNEGFDIN